MTRLEECLTMSNAAGTVKTAVIDCDGERFSYAQLESDAEDIRSILIENGVETDNRIGLFLPKSYGAISAIFGILKSKAAYVPADHQSPIQRAKYIFEHAGTRAVITDKELGASLSQALDSQHKTIPINTQSDLCLIVFTGKVPEASVSDLAYILYTSGSTGQPKGVAIRHEAALSFIQWSIDTIPLTEQDTFTSIAPFNFDLSIFDLYVSLRKGATLKLFSGDQVKNPLLVAEQMVAEQVTVCYATPTVLKMLSRYGKLHKHDLSGMRTLLFAGEVYQVKSLSELKAHLPNAVMYNLYGPTETNVCTYYRLPDQIDPERSRPFPIGKACEHIKVRLANGPSSPNSEGELCVSGISLFTSYLGLPDRTNEAFLEIDGELWYRTGDKVRVNKDLDYEYIGRLDRMVKRNGYRIELGEIENALFNHPDVSNAAVIATQEESDVKIHCFLELKTGADEVSIIEWKHYCHSQLPPYMIPDDFESVEELPKTINQKVDYQKLLQST